MAIAMSLAYTATPLAAATKLIIEATGQLSQGINFVGRSRFRQILVTAAAAASPANILAAYNAKFGALRSGRKIFIRAFVIRSNGQRSPAFSTSAVIV